MSNHRTLPQIGTHVPAASDRANRIDGASPAPTDPPLVSVVITTYDRPSFLREAVQSVLEQTYDSIELVIVDDHSETPAREAIDDLDVGSLVGMQCIRHDENRGANAARNTGVRAVTGEYVAFLDDDDRWVPEKVERQVDVFQAADQDVGVVYTGMETVEHDGRRVVIPPPVGDDLTKALLCRNVVGTMSVVMVRADIAKAVPFDEAFPAWADLEWYVRLSETTGFQRLPEPLTRYEFTSHSRLSDDMEKKRRGYELFVERFEELAAGYGRVFERKMHGWAAYRVGADALSNDHYELARTFFVTAIIFYPFESTFFSHLLASIGGRRTHGVARRLRRLTHGTSN